MSKIAIIIPVFNRLSYTKECLEILDQQKSSAFFKQNEISIIISDDGSTDGTGDWIRENRPDVFVTRGSGNLWWSGSMNIAIKYALSEIGSNYILLWENDIFPFPDYFDKLQEKLTNRKEKEIICSKIYFKVDPTIVFAMGGVFDRRSGYKKLIGRSEKDTEQYQHVWQVDWFCGQGILIHKSIFEMIGYFNEKDFPQYHGDSDFSLRASRSGYKNLVYPDLRIMNDTATTGISHIRNKTIVQFLETLFSIRSNANIIKDFKFYRQHTTSILAYKAFISRYFIYIGGFIKWKVLGLFGIRKKYTEFY